MNVKLVRLSKEYHQQLTEMMDEWVKLETRTSPGAIFKNDYHNFDYYLENLDLKEEDKDGHVPSTTFFLLDVDRNIFLGAANIRHYLKGDLFTIGGHIGDGIRPSERRKGYATEMIRLALIECKKLGIERVLMTCLETNIGSEKSIVNNGGIYENTIIEPGEGPMKRFWIDLK